LRPKNPVYAHHLGRSLLESGAASKARAALEASLALEPGQYRTHFFLGRARERLGDFRGAARAWTEAARLEPCFVPPFEHLAQLYEAWSFGARALVVVDRGLRCANPMESRSRWRLHAVCARVREQQGESESALSCYDRAIGERRKASLLFRRGLLLYRLGYHQRAGSDLREFLRTSGRSSWNARVARQILGKLR
jgi:tetratricopeptide (TPR) repeat protein